MPIHASKRATDGELSPSSVSTGLPADRSLVTHVTEQPPAPSRLGGRGRLVIGSLHLYAGLINQLSAPPFQLRPVVRGLRTDTFDPRRLLGDHGDPCAMLGTRVPAWRLA
jgi:hypothetical protein